MDAANGTRGEGRLQSRAPGLKPYSLFDVFDTLIVRAWAQPHDVFRESARLLRQRGAIAVSVDDYTVARIESERSARRASAREEITLREIFQQLQLRLGWSAGLEDEAMRLEIECECASHRLNPAMAALLAQRRAQGRAVVFVSDMYLPRETIADSLQRLGLWEHGDRLFVSSEIGLTKRTGELFRHVLAELGVPADEVEHVGDNLLSDWRAPQRLGIRATHYTTSALSSYERIADSVPALNEEVCSKFAGAMRLARLSGEARATRAGQTIWNTSTNVIGPVLFTFVAWCLQRARDRGIERLYFLARDGQILLRIIDALGHGWSEGVQCRYLYGSRQAWFPCAVAADHPETMDWALTSESGVVTLAAIAQRLGLTLEQLAVEYRRLGGSADGALSPADIALVRRAFGTPELAHAVDAHAAQARERMLDYLRQEGLFEQGSWAIVDIGWKGRLQSSLSALLQRAQQVPAAGVQGLYFALTRVPAVQPPDGFETFFFAPQARRSRRRHVCSPGVLEQFTEADHGTTIGYAREGERIVPVLLERENVRALRWGLATQHEGILAFARAIGSAVAPAQIAELIRAGTWAGICENLLAEFSYRPGLDEASVYGSFAKNSELEHVQHHELAPCLSVLESLQLIAGGPSRLATKGKPVMWVGGSLIRSGHTWASDIYRLRHRLARAF